MSMRKLLLIALLFTGLQGCGWLTKGKIRNDGVRALIGPVALRHDKYLMDAAGVSPIDSATWFGQSAKCRTLVKKPGGFVKASVLEPVLEPVLDRHDTWLQADAALPAVSRRTALRSSKLLRRILKEARK